MGGGEGEASVRAAAGGDGEGRTSAARCGGAACGVVAPWRAGRAPSPSSPSSEASSAPEGRSPPPRRPAPASPPSPCAAGHATARVTSSSGHPPATSAEQTLCTTTPQARATPLHPRRAPLLGERPRHPEARAEPPYQHRGAPHEHQILRERRHLRHRALRGELPGVVAACGCGCGCVWVCGWVWVHVWVGVWVHGYPPGRAVAVESNSHIAVAAAAVSRSLTEGLNVTPREMAAFARSWRAYPGGIVTDERRTW